MKQDDQRPQTLKSTDPPLTQSAQVPLNSFEIPGRVPDSPPSRKKRALPWEIQEDKAREAEKDVPTINQIVEAKESNIPPHFSNAPRFNSEVFERRSIIDQILDVGSNATGSLRSNLSEDSSGSKPVSQNGSRFDLTQPHPPYLRRPSIAATDVSSVAPESRMDLFRAQTSTVDVGDKEPKKSPFSSNAPSLNVSRVGGWESGSNATGSPSLSLRGAPTNSQPVNPDRSMINLSRTAPPSPRSLRGPPTAQESTPQLSRAHHPSPSKTGATMSKMWGKMKRAANTLRESRGGTQTAGSELGTGGWGRSITGRGDRRGEGISGNVSRSEGGGGWKWKSMRKWGQASEGD